jgi:hypothetical protein
MKIGMGSILAVVALLATTGARAETVVTPSNMMGWSNPDSENSGGGSSSITDKSPYHGAGSLELHGDRTRFVLGSLYSSETNLGELSKFSDLSFSYRIDPTSSNAVNPGYSPALRLTFWNGGVKDEFVFEQAYQAGGYGSEAPLGTWNITNSSSTFYLKSLGDENNQKTIADWLATGAFGNAYASAVYIGVGSGIGGANYLAYADNVIAGGKQYNFEPFAAGAVPEPTVWGMMIVGFGLSGVALRKRNSALNMTTA